MPPHMSQSLLFLTLLHCTNLLHLMHAPAPLHLILPPAPLLTFLCRPPGLYRVQEPNLAPLLAHFHSRGSLPALALLSWCQTETKPCPNIHFLETLALLDALDWRVFLYSVLLETLGWSTFFYLAHWKRWAGTGV